MPDSLPEFSKKLIAWYLANKRDLPWRGQTNPYYIWLSEIMLQQTRVEQGLPYYMNFVEAFPTVHDLAAASEEQVLKLWQGLGYYSRARNLHATAKKVSSEYAGIFPDTYEGLKALKGVGDYTASAIASISFGKPAAVVDGNVYRVLSRFFGIDKPINSSQGIREFKDLAQSLIDSNDPGTYNQAIMEFGARFCVPQNPDCQSCIFNDNCAAFASKRVKELPVKIRKQKIRKRYFNYIVPFSDSDHTVLQMREQKGIWQKLFEFPLIETDSEVTLEDLLQHQEYKQLVQQYEIRSIDLYNEQPLVHKLSHQHLHTSFWVAASDSSPNLNISKQEVHNYPMPVLIANFISEFEGFQF